MTHIPSTNPSPIFQEDKFRLNQYCLRSFVGGYKDIKPVVHFLLDYCGKEYDEMIKLNCPFEHVIEHTELGINGTCLRQYELAKYCGENIILFQECDYIYRKNIGSKIEQAIGDLGLVSPYDHPDLYNRYDIHDRENEITIVADHHFRTAKRNTMTFGVTLDILDKHYEIFKKYGYLDKDVWFDLRDAGHRLWVPIPSLATHMVEGYLSRGVEWGL